MKALQLTLSPSNWEHELFKINIDADLFLLFVSPEFTAKQELLDTISHSYPDALIIGCSTAGEISDIHVSDQTVSLTAIRMEKTGTRMATVKVAKMDKSLSAGRQLAKQLDDEDLRHILIFSDGLNVNGADLVEGLRSELPNVSITGGLAGDGSDFKKTFTIDNKNISDKMIVGLGLYGDALKVGYSSKGGWDSFGIERLVTKSDKNVLYEFDGLPALELYKSFLGEQANNLPSSGLLFPLSLRIHENSIPLVRTILAVNEKAQSLTFAGNIPQGSYVRLMKANVDRLVGGAESSAKVAINSIKQTADLAILISCVGRRLVLKQLVEEEVEAVRHVVGKNPIITGFYSYGEIAPFGEFSPCELHNQTMTITTLSEC